MNGNQHLLDQILDVIVATGLKAAAIEGAHQWHERAQQAGMVIGVAVEATDHPSPQLAFIRSHSRSQTLVRTCNAIGYTNRRHTTKINLSLSA